MRNGENDESVGLRSMTCDRCVSFTLFSIQIRRAVRGSTAYSQLSLWHIRTLAGSNFLHLHKVGRSVSEDGGSGEGASDSSSLNLDPNFFLSVVDQQALRKSIEQIRCLLILPLRTTSEGSFSAVPRPTFVSEYFFAVFYTSFPHAALTS